MPRSWLRLHSIVPLNFLSMRVMRGRVLSSSKMEMMGWSTRSRISPRNLTSINSTIEKEALALILALKHFEVSVGSVSAPVVIYTDHNPLVFINQMRNTNQRLMRWALFLQSFNVEVRHIKGREDVLADTLSRC